MKKSILIFLLVFVFPPFAFADSQTTKVLVLEFNPIIESQSSQKLSVYKKWSDPITLENQYISDINIISGSSITYQIVDRTVIDGFPAKQDGFGYTDDSYLTCLSTNTCHKPDWADYLKILSDFHVCDRVNLGEIDELWLWGGPWFGYYEAIMTGPGAFWTNGGPLTGSTCQRKLNIMGFNYERGVSEMLEDMGHRAEGTMTKVYGSWNQIGTSQHNWDRFSAYQKNKPGNAACGNVHFSPNSNLDYDWGNSSTITSSCDDWLSYPNLTGSTQPISCSTWGCEGYGYKKWWLSHLPKASGIAPDGKLANWWKYVRDYDSATSISYSGLSASLNANSANYSFTYSGTPPSIFYIHTSASPQMSTGVYMYFAYGSNSPISINNPTKWDGYSCGRTLYWVVTSSTGWNGYNPQLMSPIATNTVVCPTPAPIPGDLNNDGKVDIDDYNIMVANFGHPYTIFDYNLLVANFGRSNP